MHEAFRAIFRFTQCQHAEGKSDFPLIFHNDTSTTHTDKHLSQRTTRPRNRIIINSWIYFVSSLQMFPFIPCTKRPQYWYRAVFLGLRGVSSLSIHIHFSFTYQFVHFNIFHYKCATISMFNDWRRGNCTGKTWPELWLLIFFWTIRPNNFDGGRTGSTTPHSIFMTFRSL